MAFASKWTFIFFYSQFHLSARADRDKNRRRGEITSTEVPVQVKFGWFEKHCFDAGKNSLIQSDQRMKKRKKNQQQQQSWNSIGQFITN